MPALRIRDDISSGELRRQARRENDGRVSARLIALATALDAMDRASAARLAGMDRRTLRDWVHRDNAERIAGLCDRPKPGRTPKLSEGQMASLKAIVLAGPNPAADRIGRWQVPLCRGALGGQLQRDRNAAPAVVARSEPPQDPAAPPADRREGAAGLQKGGFAARLNGIAAAHPKAQVGQKGRTGYVWWQRGHTPRGRRDVGYQSAWIIGAVCPARDTGVALVLTRLDTDAMNLFLAELSQAVAPGAHAVVLMDKAGWHTAGDLVVPENLSLVFLPPYSPELNPIERLWLHLRDNRLTHRVFRTTDDIIDGCCDAWNWLRSETGHLHSLCFYPWLAQEST